MPSETPTAAHRRNARGVRPQLQVAEVIRAFGGSAPWSRLKRRVSRRRLRQAVAAGEVVSDHGTYSLPPTPYADRVARRLRGVRSHRSAAERWGFALPPRPDDEPERIDVIIGPNAQRCHVPNDVKLHYMQLDPDDMVDGELSPVMTVVLALRDLSLRDALSIGDSALRSGRVTFEQLRERTNRLRKRGAARARRRVELLDGRSANAFASSCRALLIESGITGFEAQVTIRQRGFWIARVDLAHRRWRVAIECDGFETHGTLAAMTQDCIRHTNLVSAGWRPLRFTWHQVMFEPAWVRAKVSETLQWAELCPAATGH